MDTGNPGVPSSRGQVGVKCRCLDSGEGCQVSGVGCQVSGEGIMYSYQVSGLSMLKTSWKVRQKCSPNDEASAFIK